MGNDYLFHDIMWEYRYDAVARLIPEGVTLLDLGGGEEHFKNYLKSPKLYDSWDVYPCTPNTRVVDFDSDQFKGMVLQMVLQDGVKYDYVLCQGLLEYLFDIKKFLRTIGNLGEHFIFTYYQSATKFKLWNNNFTFVEIEKMFLDCGYKILSTHKVPGNSQQIYVCSHEQ